MLRLSRRIALRSLAVCIAVGTLAAGCSKPAAGPSSNENAADVLLGKPWQGATEAAPRDANGKPILTGFWKLLREDGKPDGNLGKDRPGFTLPYTARGREALTFNQTNTLDPEARCLIAGSPRLTTSVLPFEILHTPKRLGFFYALSWHRWVWLDGRLPEPDPDPHYLGNNVGHWEGDTLVIEANGFKDSADGKFWLDDNGNPQSGQSKIVERWTRSDLHHLDLELIYTDPLYYSEPIRYTRHWVLGAPGEQLQEFSCEWNTPWVLSHLEPGPGKIGADGNRGFGPGGQVVPDLPLGAVDGSESRGTGYWLYRKNKPKPSDPPEERTDR
ncbi:MAG: hypothetical protein ABW136_12985 [Steroidobacteraceae bacterium]